MFRIVPVAWVHLEYIAGDRRQNLRPKFAQEPEQSEFTYSAYLEAAGWPLHDIFITNRVWCMAYQREVEGGSYIAQ